jgi:hypothetical protein
MQELPPPPEAIVAVDVVAGVEPPPAAISFEAALAIVKHPVPAPAIQPPPPQLTLADPYEQILSRRRAARTAPPPRGQELPVVSWLVSKLRRWAGF